MRNSASQSNTYERRIEAATERMARRMGASFERNDRWTEVVRASDVPRQERA